MRLCGNPTAWYLFLATGPRTGASGGNVSPLTTGLQKKSIMAVRFRRKIIPFFFLNEPIAGTPRYVCEKVQANIRRSECAGPIWLLETAFHAYVFRGLEFVLFNHVSGL